MSAIRGTADEAGDRGLSSAFDPKRTLTGTADRHFILK
jgi:hypothetical protein